MDWGENFEKNLVKWFRKNKREMPWREDPTPYHVVVSELMLQQTRVDTVLPYYARFLETCPDFQTLAGVSDDTLLKLWEGLGYYTRARNLKKLAQQVVTELNGRLPEDPKLLEKLPGIGPYTAGAVASIAYHLPVPLVDGNVLRVITRYLGLTWDIAKDETKKKLSEELRKRLLKSKADPSEFNQGLMELGALVCMPSGLPKCAICPLKDHCQTYAKKCFLEIPVKTAKPKVLTEEKTVLIFKKGNQLGIQKRKEKGLLSNLYGYPILDGRVSAETLKTFLEEIGENVLSIRPLEKKKHVFTHRIWEMYAYEINLATSRKKKFSFHGEEVLLMSQKKIEEEIPLPTAFRKWK